MTMLPTTSAVSSIPSLAAGGASISSAPIDSACAAEDKQPEPGGILADLEHATRRQAPPASHHDRPQTPGMHQARPVRTNIDSTPQALDDLFKRLAQENPSRPVAVISGGGLSGCSTALELANQGYQVVVAEKRETYSRQNVLSLKTDTLLYWASLSPDGGLLRSMLQNRSITPCTHEIVPAPNTATGYATVLNPAIRFLNWLLPPAALPPLIPVRERHAERQAVQQDLAGLCDTVPRPAARPLVEALDPAWPANEPVSAVRPDDWQSPPAEFFSSENMVFGQIRDLESTLNEYCLRQPSIHIVRAAIELVREAGDHGDYRPAFVLENAPDPQRFVPPRRIALIGLAEGAHSPNREKVGGEMPPVATNESWQQGNYVGSPSNIGGFNIVDMRPDTLIVTQHIEQPEQSLVNISVFHPTDQVPHPDTIVDQLHQAQAHVDTAAAAVAIQEENRVYDSGQIDVYLRMARNPMQHNVVQLGDTAFSGSPVGGYGGSVAGSQFAQLVRDTIQHPLFSSCEPEDRLQLEEFYRKRVADIRDVRSGRASATLRELGVYSPETFAASIRQASAARFGGLAEIDVPPENPGARR